MKLLHTSDWHLGHTLYGYDRTEEQRDMLGQIATIAADEQPDALLVSGDVFHSTTPTAAAQQLFVEAMMELHRLVPAMQIVVTAGNHDSATRHEVFRRPWQTLNVHTVGTVERGHETDCIIELPGKGFVVAVPYVNEHYLSDDFYPRLLRAVDEMNGGALPVVMMAHTTVSNEECGMRNEEFCGDEELVGYGGIDAVPLSFFGEGYDYLALGHIHRSYDLSGSEGRARYCGSPLPVSFDEDGVHSVTLVEIDNHGDRPKRRIVPIENPRPLVTLPSKGFASWEEALQQLAQYDAESMAYVRLNVEVDDFLPAGANAEAAQTVKEKQCRFCFINARRRERERTESAGLTVSEFRRESPLSLVRRYASDKGLPFDDELAELLNGLSGKLKIENCEL